MQKLTPTEQIIYDAYINSNETVKSIASSLGRNYSTMKQQLGHCFTKGYARRASRRLRNLNDTQRLDFLLSSTLLSGFSTRDQVDELMKSTRDVDALEVPVSQNTESTDAYAHDDQM